MMKQFLNSIPLLLLTLSCSNLFAQSVSLPLAGQARIDSLLKEVPKQKDDTNKVNILTAISYACSGVDPDEGIKYGQQALALATKLNWNKRIGDANSTMGANYMNKSGYTKALEYYFKALQIYTEIGNKIGAASANQNIGKVYTNKSDYPKALEYYFNALRAYEQIGDKAGIANATSVIGSVYASQGNYPNALEYDFKALKMYEGIGMKSGMSYVSGNIGLVYQSEGDCSKALEYNFKALKVYEEIGDKANIAAANVNIGAVYELLSDYSKALECDIKALNIAEETANKYIIAYVAGAVGDVYTHKKNYILAIEYQQQALKIAEDIGDKNDVARRLEGIGEAFLSLVTAPPGAAAMNNSNSEIAQGKYLPAGQPGQPNIAVPASKDARLHKAIDYLQQGLIIGKEINAPNIIQEGYQYLDSAYRLTGNYKKALEAADNYHAVKDSVFSKDNGEKIVKMEVKNEYERQRLADSLRADAKEKIAHIKLQRQRSYTCMGIAGILLLAGFSFFIIKERGKSEKERKKSDALLLNILPGEIATELKANGSTIARHYDNVTVLFTDFVNFTEAGERMSPQTLIDELHTCFKAFDDITTKYSVEKIKTIGDAYLAVAGLPSADALHAEHVVRAAIEINAFIEDRFAKLGSSTFEIRIGIHSGSVVAGIVGVKKFAYDIWGDTVNTAARMEQSSMAGRINISQTTYELVKDKIACEYRGEIEAKGKGVMKMYFING